MPLQPEIYDGQLIRRVITVVVGTLWLGAVAFGYFYNAALALGWM
ncbi:MAG: hypothetical protein AB1649_26125 [Chloroflexota bacterium]